MIMVGMVVNLPTCRDPPKNPGREARRNLSLELLALVGYR
jgi:hypothetical protein